MSNETGAMKQFDNALRVLYDDALEVLIYIKEPKALHMPTSPNKRAKLLHLMKVLQVKTDEQNPMTISEIIAELSAHDVKAERKSIYSNLKPAAVWFRWLCKDGVKCKVMTLTLC